MDTYVVQDDLGKVELLFVASDEEALEGVKVGFLKARETYKEQGKILRSMTLCRTVPIAIVDFGFHVEDCGMHDKKEK